MSDIGDLEYPTLKVPYEILNKRFRNAQKNLDRDVSNVQAACRDLTQISNPNDSDSVNKALDTVIEKLKNLKRKATESLECEREVVASCRVRLSNLMERGTETVASESWERQRLNRMLADHLLQSGYVESAQRLIEAVGLQDLTNLSLFVSAKKIEQALLSGSTGPCLVWCYDNKSKLKKLQSRLEFRVRQQDFIELVKQEKRIEAITYARKYLANPEDASLLDEVRTVMGLLAYSRHTSVEAYQELLAESRWHSLALQFRQENLRLYQLSSQTPFMTAIQVGLSVLKTPQCCQENERKADCPACSPLFADLVRSLPFAHCVRSRLNCFITGQTLDEHNPPLMLPNGYVYGKEALESMMRDQGLIVCPRTGDSFTIVEASKVFIM